jgi:addiction module HigA family antidote
LSARLDCLEALGLFVAAGARVLGVSRKAPDNLMNEWAGISPEVAIHFDRYFGGTAEAWLALAATYDLAKA